MAVSPFASTQLDGARDDDVSPSTQTEKPLLAMDPS
jgi:hypothetical protein